MSMSSPEGQRQFNGDGISVLGAPGGPASRSLSPARKNAAKALQVTGITDMDFLNGRYDLQQTGLFVQRQGTAVLQFRDGRWRFSPQSNDGWWASSPTLLGQWSRDTSAGDAITGLYPFVAAVETKEPLLLINTETDMHHPQSDKASEINSLIQQLETAKLRSEHAGQLRHELDIAQQERHTERSLYLKDIANEKDATQHYINALRNEHYSELSQVTSEKHKITYEANEIINELQHNILQVQQNEGRAVLLYEEAEAYLQIFSFAMTPLRSQVEAGLRAALSERLAHEETVKEIALKSQQLQIAENNRITLESEIETERGAHHKTALGAEHLTLELENWRSEVRETMLLEQENYESRVRAAEDKMNSAIAAEQQVIAINNLQREELSKLTGQLHSADDEKVIAINHLRDQVEKLSRTRVTEDKVKEELLNEVTDLRLKARGMDDIRSQSM